MYPIKTNSTLYFAEGEVGEIASELFVSAPFVLERAPLLLEIPVLVVIAPTLL
jgi:hypothetical protein